MRSRGSPSLFIVGAGRLGRTLARAVRSAGLDLLGTWNREPTGAARTRRLCGGPAHARRLPPTIRDAEIVLITTADHAIASIAGRLAEEALVGPGQVVAHCAGALDLTCLDPCAAAGAAVGSLHPLRAFSDPAAGRVRLAGTLCVVDGEEDTRRVLERLSRRLGLVPTTLGGDAESRSLYHAAAVCAAGHLCALVASAVNLAREAGLDAERALPGLLSLARGTLDGIEAQGLSVALTGPVARGDDAVIEAHRLAIAKRAPELLPLYDALLEAARRLSRR